MDYRQAGVDVEAGRAFVSLIRRLVDSTRRPEVLGELGGFGGLFQVPLGYREPVLVAGTDGVGTKLKLAHQMNCHDTIGIDLVAMCVNDVLTCGAEPLFFLDYLAVGQLEPAQLAKVVAGIAVGCQQANCALLGGETAEMPGFYAPGEYDAAGFCVGIVEKGKILTGDRVQIGDWVIGLASQGVHSNGYSLVRKIVADGGYEWSHRPEGLAGATLGETLLKPTQIYVQPVRAALAAGLEIHAMAHVTGGGLPENLPRCLGTSQSIYIENRWPVPPIFDWLRQAGSVPLSEMYKTFNMGIGYALVVPEAAVDATLAHFRTWELGAYAMGCIAAGEGLVLGLPER